MKTILIVDDSEINIESLVLILEDKYELLATTDANEVLDILENEKVDLILLDIIMPSINGYDVCNRIKSNKKTANIPIIFITAKTDEESIEKAYDVGGIDYITKPFRPKEVLSRISNHLALSQQQHFLEEMVASKTKELQELNQELINTQQEIILTLGIVGEYRSRETSNHVNRVALYSKILASEYNLDKQDIKTLQKVSPMHDIGKVGIADAILNKPAKLTPEEFKVIKTHTDIGYDILKNSTKKLLKYAAIVAYEHHEKWDGSGYPRGIKGNNIHIFGRITALADVFDALSTKRPYKEAWENEKIFQFIKDEKGKHFEPKLVDIFFGNLDEILKIQQDFKDQ